MQHFEIDFSTFPNMRILSLYVNIIDFYMIAVLVGKKKKSWKKIKLLFWETFHDGGKGSPKEHPLQGVEICSLETLASANWPLPHLPSLPRTHIRQIGLVWSPPWTSNFQPIQGLVEEVRLAWAPLTLTQVLPAHFHTTQHSKCPLANSKNSFSPRRVASF